MADFIFKDNEGYFLFEAVISTHTLYCLYDFFHKFYTDFVSDGENQYHIDMQELKKKVLSITLGEPEDLCDTSSVCTREEVLNDLLAVVGKLPPNTYYIYYGY